MIPALIDLSQQCCDADAYVSLGYICARTGQCYNELRPMGDALWFSIPFRLGSSLDTLLYLRLMLLGLVSFTSFYVFNACSAPRTGANRMAAAGFNLLFLALLVLLIWPTSFNTLSDTPATLFFVEGVLLLWLARTNDSRRLYLLAGLFFGGSAFLRAAYFNPLIVACGLFAILWLRDWLNGKRHWKSIFLLSLFLPISVQVYYTWKYERTLAFMPSARTTALIRVHLSSGMEGYDTALPQTEIDWTSRNNTTPSMVSALVNQQWHEALMIIAGRFYFSFGSYATHTYFNRVERNYLDAWYSENIKEAPRPYHIGDIPAWTLHNAMSLNGAARSPVGDETASVLHRTSVPGNNPDAAYFQSSSFMPLPEGKYRYSLWLWQPESARSQTVIVEIYRLALARNTGWYYDPVAPDIRTKPLSASQQQHLTNLHNPLLNIMAEKFFHKLNTYDERENMISISRIPVPQESLLLMREEIPVTGEHKQFMFSANNPDWGYLAMRVYLPGSGTLAAWGAKLAPGDQDDGYIRHPHKVMAIMGDSKDGLGRERLFSHWLLALNLLVLVAGLLFQWQSWKKTQSPLPAFIVAFVVLAIIQSLLFIPEQRFIQSIIITNWFCFLSGLYHRNKSTS